MLIWSAAVGWCRWPGRYAGTAVAWWPAFVHNGHAGPWGPAGYSVRPCPRYRSGSHAAACSGYGHQSAPFARLPDPQAASWPGMRRPDRPGRQPRPAPPVVRARQERRTISRRPPPTVWRAIPVQAWSENAACPHCRSHAIILCPAAQRNSGYGPHHWDQPQVGSEGGRRRDPAALDQGEAGIRQGCLSLSAARSHGHGAPPVCWVCRGRVRARGRRRSHQGPAFHRRCRPIHWPGRQR